MGADADAVAGPRDGAATVLAGRYRLVERLAAGSMGVVWRAHDELLGREVAVKLLRDDLVDDDTARERFRDEARNAAVLRHPGIATVHDYGETTSDGGGTPFIVMELVDGEPLSSVLRRTPVPPLATTLSIVAEVAEALHAAHSRGIVHRDVKPANVMVRTDGHAAVTDFGIARALDGARHTRGHEVVGTARYMSPEQATGGDASAASDVYALGVVAHEMLRGAPPFDGSTPAAVALAHVRDEAPPLPASVPADVRALVEAALSKDPRDRPSDAAAFARGLRTAAAAAVAPGSATSVGDALAPTAQAPVPHPARTSTMPPPTILAAPPSAPAGSATADPVAAGLPRPTDVAGAAGVLPRRLGAERRRRRGALWSGLAAGAVALVGGAVVLVAAGSGDDDGPAPTSSVAAVPATPPVSTAPVEVATTAVAVVPVSSAPAAVTTANEAGGDGGNRKDGGDDDDDDDKDKGDGKGRGSGE